MYELSAAAGRDPVDGEVCDLGHGVDVALPQGPELIGVANVLPVLIYQLESVVLARTVLASLPRMSAAPPAASAGGHPSWTQWASGRGRAGHYN